MRERWSLDDATYSLPLTLRLLMNLAKDAFDDGMNAGMGYEFDSLLGITSQRTDG